MSIHVPLATLSQSIPKVWNELSKPERLEALAETALLGSPTEHVFDRFTALARRLLKARFSMVTLVDKDHQFFKSQSGLQEPLASERRTPLSHSICQYVVAAAEPLIVSDAREHPLLRGNCAITGINAIAYLGIPLTTREGHTLGSFCAIDDHPRDWTQDEIDVMQDLAGAIIGEIELRLLARHFQASFLHVRELEVERDGLVYMLVHDLRNPLSSLISGLDMLRDSKSLREARDFVAVASCGALSLLHMVNSILDVSKSEAGRLTLQLGPVDAGKLIELACGMVRDLAVVSDIAVEMIVEPGLPLFEADAEALRRTLINLISNAIQHTPCGGRVAVSARREGDRIIFSVADTGKGIPVEAFSQIFEKFGASTARQGGRVSTGLGLHFSKIAIEAHGGHIDVQSELGKGTTFRFDIPLSRTASAGI